MSKEIEIPMHKCDSTCITHHGYDPASKIMALRFVGGASHRYADVPAETYQGLTGAKSMGAYYGKSIKGRFKAP